MKKIKIIICILVCIGTIGIILTINFIANFDQEINQQSLNFESDINFLWNKTIYKMLQDPLWEKRDAYDSSHFLMVPLHWAFVQKDNSKINDFHQFFDKFVKNYNQEEFDSLGKLNKLHFLYLLSEYLTLTKMNEEIPSEELVSISNASLEFIWNQQAGQWKECNSPIFSNMQERINWKLKNKNVPVSYCRAIIDEELFTFAIAADLNQLLEQNPKFIDEIVNMSYRVFKQEVVFYDSISAQWLFQPGVWTDHRDYVYAGNFELTSNLEKKSVENIAWDSSHSHRFPLWLLSIERSFCIQGDLNKAEYFKKLRQGLADQFLTNVLVMPSEEFSNYRTTNFMDGYNGIYRYNYITQGLGGGIWIL